MDGSRSSCANEISPNPPQQTDYKTVPETSIHPNKENCGECLHCFSVSQEASEPSPHPTARLKVSALPTLMGDQVLLQHVFAFYSKCKEAISCGIEKDGKHPFKYTLKYAWISYKHLGKSVSVKELSKAEIMCCSA